METKTIAELGILLTPETESYWNRKGAYQAEFDRLFDELVPQMGAAETLNGELVRAISRLTYEYLNNGNCNAAVVVTPNDHPWDFSEEDEDNIDWDEVECVGIDTYYGKFIDLIQETLYNKINHKEVDELIDKVKGIIENRWVADHAAAQYFSPDYVNAYSRLADLVIWYVLNTPDSEIPVGYDRS